MTNNNNLSGKSLSGNLKDNILKMNKTTFTVSANVGRRFTKTRYPGMLNTRVQVEIQYDPKTKSIKLIQRDSDFSYSLRKSKCGSLHLNRLTKPLLDLKMPQGVYRLKKGTHSVFKLTK